MAPGLLALWAAPSFTLVSGWAQAPRASLTRAHIQSSVRYTPALPAPAPGVHACSPGRSGWASLHWVHPWDGVQEKQPLLVALVPMGVGGDLRGRSQHWPHWLQAWPGEWRG